MAQVDGRGSPADREAFEAAVRRQLGGAARRKASGCRTGHYVLREDAEADFTRLAREHGLEVYVCDAADLERPGRSGR